MNFEYVSRAVSENLLGGFIDLFAGGALSSFSLFALGIMPYITASIIMNLLTMALPPLERLSKEGPEGRKKIASITRYAGVGLGLVQAIALLLTFGEAALIQTGTPMILSQITIVLCLTAGTALIMWIGEHITENGVGNGISLVIFINIIISRLPITGGVQLCGQRHLRVYTYLYAGLSCWSRRLPSSRASRLSIWANAGSLCSMPARDRAQDVRRPVYAHTDENQPVGRDAADLCDDFAAVSGYYTQFLLRQRRSFLFCRNGSWTAALPCAVRAADLLHVFYSRHLIL